MKVKMEAARGDEGQLGTEGAGFFDTPAWNVMQTSGNIERAHIPTANPQPANPVNPSVPLLVDEMTDVGPDENTRAEAPKAVHVWRGKELLPFTQSVQGIWERLSVHDLPLPALLELGVIDLYLPRAVKLLYLLSHEKSAYRSLRATPLLFIEAVEKWQDETFQPGDEAAVELALKIFVEAKGGAAVPKV